MKNSMKNAAVLVLLVAGLAATSPAQNADLYFSGAILKHGQDLWVTKPGGDVSLNVDTRGEGKVFILVKIDDGARPMRMDGAMLFASARVADGEIFSRRYRVPQSLEGRQVLCQAYVLRTDGSIDRSEIDLVDVKATTIDLNEPADKKDDTADVLEPKGAPAPKAKGDDTADQLQ